MYIALCLAWIVTPEGTDQLVQGQYYADTCALARNYCYLYYYDSRSRQIEKHMPGRAAGLATYEKLAIINQNGIVGLRIFE